MYASAAKGVCETYSPDLRVELNDSANVSPPSDACLLEAVQKGDENVILRILGTQNVDPNSCSPTDEPLILVALKQGHDQIVHTLVEYGASVNQYDSNGKNVLHYLACTSKVEIINFVIQQGADVNTRDSEDKTPLHYAAAVNNIESTLVLVDNGASPDQVDSHQMTPLVEAAKHGSLEVCKFLISIGVDVNHHDVNDMSALHHACRGGYLPIVQVLLESHAKFSQTSAGETELMLAVEARAPNIVKTLIDNKAKACLINRKKMTALHLAAKIGSVKSAQLLSANKGILDCQDRKGMTSLMVAARHGQHEVMTVLIGAGAQIASQDQQLLAALHHAALQGHLSCVMLMLRNGARMDHPGQNGNLPIMLAAHSGHAEVVKLLLAASKGNQYWNINTSNHDHMTALHLSAERGHYQCAEFLLQEGADPSRPNRNGDTPIMLAAKRGFDKILQLLLRYIMTSADPGHCLNEVNLMKKTALHTAAKTGASECVQVLLAAGALPDIRDVHGKTALINAVEQGYDIIVDRLIRAKADVNMKTDEGWTALHLAAQNNFVAIVSMLLEAGVDPDALVRMNGITPCLLAATRGHYGVMRVLLKKGCNSDHADFSGMTALHKVARGGHGPCARLLLNHGAQVDPDSMYGLTPAMVAVTEGHRRVLRILLEANCNITKVDPLRTKQNKKFCTIMEMLLIAGCHVNMEALGEMMNAAKLPTPLVNNPHLLQRLLDWGSNPQPLRQISRILIRGHLGYDIARKTQHLPLPAFLKDYILLKELRDIIILEQTD